MIAGVVLFLFYRNVARPAFIGNGFIPQPSAETAVEAPPVDPALALSEIVQAAEKGQVVSLMVEGNQMTATLEDGTTIQANKEPTISALETLRLLGASDKALAGLPVQVAVAEAEGPNPVVSWLAILSLFFIAGMVFRVLRHRGTDGGSGLSSIGRSSARVSNVRTKKGQKEDEFAPPAVTFADVAGAEIAKLELQEVIEFLKDPGRFHKLGARVPRGVLMAGPPGTGKTLMAKAVAGEAGVAFFSISGSEFVEMFVGVGAARVRDLFKRARQHAPAVIFIDEIDAVGRRRGGGYGNGNDEREQTLNQILVEMDGFNTDTTVIVMASTNRPDILDPALLRPGRFDRKVIIDRPDVNAREEILRVHTRGKPLAPDVSLPALAKLTPGFVGADLANLVNEAAILAARRNLTVIGQAEFQDAMERIVAGPERQGKIISDYERKVVAYHEAGHAVVMHYLEHSDPVHKVSIVSRGMALGYTMPLPESDKYLRSREAFEDEIVGLLGGRAAEEVIFKRITTGAANDLERATKLARAMVTRYGFSQKLGLRTFGEDQGSGFLGGLGEIRDYSEEMAQAIDREIRQILDTAYQRAKTIVQEKRQALDALANALLEHETIERPQFEALMG
ncbi:MAG: ATP-dependent zinc metalloprotease FtsH [Chloroflexi bacterium]|nr:MAG: ATP-dependent zinc metalloprotease FtsH [Chloroflexota bacterium]